jgi:aspartyl-tRNA(Asn)/glutamyl-tRNA(Gln) amidotransferase subunit B
MEYEPIICFETHVELNTETKLFCDCSVEFGARPNSQICPVCTGQPGALPVLNKKAVEYCLRAGLALNCSINRESRFARKNYFYPDLPKGYQISQYELPFCENGYLEIQDENGFTIPVGIKRIHLEEDAGKLLHSPAADDSENYSYLDYNRSSIPLLEIVCDHECNPLGSLNQARSFLENLRQIIRYIDISECIIEKGQFRCDVNISVRPKGSQYFGNRTEIKNMASFKFIMEALEYEIKRQIELLKSGGKVEQETRLFDENKKITNSMRSKEDAPDYRYFADPDLDQVEIDREFIKRIKNNLPELPDQKIRRFMDQYGLSQYDTLTLTKEKSIAEFFEACIPHCKNVKKLARWTINELFKLLNESLININDSGLDPKNFAELINLISQREITEEIGKSVLREIFKTGERVSVMVNQKSLKTIQDVSVIERKLDEVIAKNTGVASQIKQGKTKPINFLVGLVMRETAGKANPQTIRELILKKLHV